MRLAVNDRVRTLDGVDPQTPLLWVIRDMLGLKGTKFGCGIAMCGACTVHIDGLPTRSCSVPVGAVAGRKVTTIEEVKGPVADAVRAAWIANNVPQCGYCQSGQIMSAVGLLTENPSPAPLEVEQAMSGNICRCGTYPRIKAAILEAAAGMAKAPARG